MLEFYKITALSTALFHIALTLFVISRGLNKLLGRVYGLWGASLSLWNLCTFLKAGVPEGQEESDISYLWLRLLHVGLIFLPVTIFHLSLLFAQIKAPRLLTCLYVVHCLFALSVFTPAYIEAIRASKYGPIVSGGPAFKCFFVLHAAITVLTIVLLYVQQRKTTKLQKTRLRSLLIATIILAVFGSHDLLLVYGQKYYPVIHVEIVPLGNLAAMFFGIVVSYSVLQYQLLNIQVSFSRFAAQAVRFLFMFLTSFTLLLFVKQLGEDLFPAFAFYMSLAVFLTSALLASCFFPRFLGKGEEKLERRLLGDWFEYHDKINHFIQTLPSFAQVDLILDELDDLLINTVRVKHYQVILMDETKQAFSLARSQPLLEKTLLPELTLESPIFKVFETTKSEYFAMKISYALPGETPVERNARDQFSRFESEFAFPFMSGKDPFGLLLIGEKETGEIYTRYDLSLFIQMLRHLSLVLNQIRLKNKLLQTEQMELLGTMSRGIAHDMNNLLTPVSTYLQLSRDGDVDESVNQELLPMALRNVETMRSYIHEALFFSKTQRLQLKKVCFEQLIHNVVDMVQSPLKKKSIRLDIQVSGLLEAEIDEILIQRLIYNLLSNAIDASRTGSQIYISVVRLGRMQSGSDWYRLRVIDEGEGISRENLKKVSTPYFTTKDRGDSGRGFGLGLAICRKIVHLHHGNMTITSELNKGTMVQVDIPDRFEPLSPQSKSVTTNQVASVMADVA